jgi:predicted O-linked N-acetylglucosamine transferase (SPINDLY family)
MNRGGARPETAEGADTRSRSERLGDPTVSVVITNWNYGHFLADCIDSVLGQTCPPEQVIVVDDGSTDGSAHVLAAYGGRVEALGQGNAGQAAAFNAGFRRASGDVVIFLDADDLLRPEAIETILTNWSDDLAILSFGLETIDAAGRSQGLYSETLAADDGDNRPRVLRDGNYVFAPTSGNAFSRACLADILPMPEERWRISADCYLLRAAALWGRVAVVRRVLGAYRTHGGNNYFRGGSRQFRDDTRGIEDVADALEALAQSPRLPVAAAEEAGVLRLALRLRALEFRRRLAHRADAPHTLAQHRTRNIMAALRSALPFRDRLAAAAAMAAIGRTGRAGWRLRRWLAESTLRAKLDSVERPRWPEGVPFGQILRFDEVGPQQNMLAEGWLPDLYEGWRWSDGRPVALEFALEPTPAPIEIEMKIAVAPEAGDIPVRFALTVDGQRLWAGSIVGEGVIAVTLERPPFAPRHVVRLSLSCEAPHLQPRPERLFAVQHLRASVVAVEHAFPHLQVGLRRRFGALLAVRNAQAGWLLGENDVACMTGTEAALRFSLAGPAEPLDLVLAPAPPFRRGWLRITLDDADLFFGETGTGAELRLPIPEGSSAGARQCELRFIFRSSDAAAPHGPSFREIAIVRRRASPIPLGERPQASPLNIGQQVFLDAPSAQADSFLRAGWDEPAEEGVRNAASEASLAFRAPKRASDLTLRLDLRPALPTPPGKRHVVGFSARGQMLQWAELAGEGTVTVPIPDTVISVDGDVVLTLHSIAVGDAPDEAALAEPPFAALELRSFTLEGRIESGADLPPPPADIYPKPELLGLIEGASRALKEMPEAARQRRLADMRDRLSALLAAADPRALLLVAAHPDGLGVLANVRAATEGAPHTGRERDILGEMERRPAASDDRERLRVFLLGMLLVPAFRLPIDIDLAELPAPLLWNSWPVALYLVRDPPLIVESRETEALVLYLETLLQSVDAVLASERPHAAVYWLAKQIVTVLHSKKSLFGSQNLLTLSRVRSRCIERMLSQSGAQLASTRHHRPGAGKLRLGVLVRDVLPVPEGWALLGMYRNLDRSQFEPIVITMAAWSEGRLDTGHRFAWELSVEDMSVEEAVGAIRALDLDLFLLGSYVAGWEKLSAIVAHRLGRVQVLPAAVCPTTGGFRSFDYALSCRATEPDDAQAHYSEELAWLDGPLQCCYEFSAIETGLASLGIARRRELDIAEDAIVLVSGAMAHKISPELARCWACILARAPETVLVLYPFAANWGTTYAKEQFRAFLLGELVSAGVAADRLVVLGEQTLAQVRGILAASDVYLDSFPYTGATTVCEALASGVPVVTLAGHTLRGLTGASWVRAYGLEELVAETSEEYVAMASRLCNSPDARQAVAARVREILHGTPPHFNPAAFGAAFSDALWELAKKRRLVEADTLARLP